MEERMVRKQEAMTITGLRYTAFHEEVKKGRIRPIKIGVRAVAYLESELQEWIRDRVEESIEDKSNGTARNSQI